MNFPVWICVGSSPDSIVFWIGMPPHLDFRDSNEVSGDFVGLDHIVPSRINKTECPAEL